MNVVPMGLRHPRGPHRAQLLCWAVIVGWVLALVLLEPVASGLSQLTNVTASAYLPPGAPSTRVALLQEAAQHGRGQPESEEAIVVFSKNGPLGPRDLAAITWAREAVRRLAGKVRGLSAPSPQHRSIDGQATTFTVTVTAPQHSILSATSEAVAAIRHAVGAASRRAGDGLAVAVTGLAAVSADSAIPTQTSLVLTAVVIVAVILLAVYRSPLLWLLPLAAALAAIVVAQAAAHGLAASGLTVSPLSTSILIVLVFGAASDYALLLVHRYREELHRHGPPEAAMAMALRATLPTLLASAATVTGAMLCLLAAESASLHGLGPIGAVAILSALLAETTLLPALLLVVGRRAFWPLIPRPQERWGEESRLWSRIGARVARGPRRIALLALVFLALACLGLLSVQTTNDPLSDLKGRPGSVVGAQVLAAHYPAGTIAPLVLLTAPRSAAIVAAITRSIHGIAAISPGASVEGYAGFTVTLSVPPYSSAAATVIRNLRRRLASGAPGALVGGEPALQYDIVQAAAHDSDVLFPLVLVEVLLVIALLLRAIVAPLILVATTALSFAASFALSDLVWRLVFGFPGFAAQLPLYIFIFLVALGIDYNIFLSARVREEARRVGTQQGMLRGLAVTGGVITAAGIVLAGTFAALAQLPSMSLTEVGTAVALGVLLDTLLVRTIVVPAVVLSVDDRLWWPSHAAPPCRTSTAREHEAVDGAP